MLVDMADADNGEAMAHERYRYRRQHVIQSLLVSSDESDNSDSDTNSDVSTSDSRSR